VPVLMPCVPEAEHGACADALCAWGSAWCLCWCTKSELMHGAWANARCTMWRVVLGGMPSNSSARAVTDNSLPHCLFYLCASSLPRGVPQLFLAAPSTAGQCTVVQQCWGDCFTMRKYCFAVRKYCFGPQRYLSQQLRVPLEGMLHWLASGQPHLTSLRVL